MAIKNLLNKIGLKPFLVVIIAFIIAIVSVSSVRITEMQSGDWFVESITPLPYWIAIVIIACATFMMLRILNDKVAIILTVLSSIILLVAFRLAFPVMFTSVPGYEPDASSYMSTVNSWVNNGLDFGQAGNYYHDYPLSFLLGFLFVKLGVPLDTYFRVAPFVIYIVCFFMLYLIVRELIPQNQKVAVVAGFLFSFSSLSYWMGVHYCPDILGVMFYFICLYLTLKFSIKGTWTIKALAPVCGCIILLVLSHHLSTLYFIITLFGLAFSMWFIKPKAVKGGALSFFLLAIFTYTFWFAYGTFEYPNFFNVYSYFGGSYGSPTALVQQAPIFVTFSYWLYPIFIITLFAFEFLSILGIKKISDIISLKKKIIEARTREQDNLPFFFVIGFIPILILMVVGIGLAVSFPTRVLEVFFIAVYPLSSLTFIKFTGVKLSRKGLILILSILVLIVIVGEHRYLSQMQRRVLIG